MNWQGYSVVDHTSASESASRESLAAILKDVKEQVLAHVVASAEPHVWTTHDRTGRTHWKAYDPTTNQSVDWLSEEDLRIWLEKRHHINRWYAKV
ncbi:MAG: hypothetical protein HC881_09795 [Leptolyngbyaceae cyanobacterium SL_7_1]|nr:hypothetical protein [Leptolyngbyaceae cyanobacterium SL_7_1]